MRRPLSVLARAAALLGVLLVLSLDASNARAALVPPAASDGYRISVLTMGPGDSLTTMFGHDALLVERAGLPALVYNFGWYTEAAIAPHHVLGGTLRYFLDVEYFESTVASYRSENRSVTLQVLALDSATAERLADALSENSKPGNTEYDYDFALDNCTTRVRDALDRALGGRLRAEVRGTAPYTYRDHALRFTADAFPLYFLFDLGLGKRVDRPLDAWDDAYLPDRLAAYLRRIRVTDASGTHPLVLRETTLFAATRAPAREKPPVRAPWHALAGVGLGAVFFALGRASAPPARVALGLGSLVLGALVGMLGLWVLLLALTNVHVTSDDNFNLLVCSPWAFGMVWGGLRVALGRPTGPRVLARRAAETALISVVGVVLAVLYGQDSLRVALLVVPPIVGVWLGARGAEGAAQATATPTPAVVE
jgi:hypothetical protein